MGPQNFIDVFGRRLLIARRITYGSTSSCLSEQCLAYQQGTFFLLYCHCSFLFVNQDIEKLHLVQEQGVLQQLKKVTKAVQCCAQILHDLSRLIIATLLLPLLLVINSKALRTSFFLFLQSSHPFQLDSIWATTYNSPHYRTAQSDGHWFANEKLLVPLITFLSCHLQIFFLSLRQSLICLYT